MNFNYHSLSFDPSRIEPVFTVSVADVLSTQPLIGFFTYPFNHLKIMVVTCMDSNPFVILNC